MSRNEDYLDNLLNSVTSFKEELDVKTGVKDQAVKRELEDETQYDPDMESFLDDVDDESFLAQFEHEFMEEDEFGDSMSCRFIPNDYTSESAGGARSFIDEIDDFDFDQTAETIEKEILGETEDNAPTVKEILNRESDTGANEVFADTTDATGGNEVQADAGQAVGPGLQLIAAEEAHFFPYGQGFAVFIRQRNAADRAEKPHFGCFNGIDRFNGYFVFRNVRYRELFGRRCFRCLQRRGLRLLSFGTKRTSIT